MKRGWFSLRKIGRKELDLLLEEAYLTVAELENLHPMDVYHLHEWDHTTILGEDNRRRNLQVSMRKFYFDMKDMLEFLAAYLHRLSFS